MIIVQQCKGMNDQERVDVAKSLFGILPQTMTLEEAMAERADEV